MATAQETYRMLERETLWTTAQHCHAALAAAGVPHAIVGGVAVCLHGYQRSTVDLDLIVRREDQPLVRTALADAGCLCIDEHKEFRAAGDIPVQFLLAGDRAGQG